MRIKINNEKNATKVAAVFDNEQQAKDALQTLSKTAEFEPNNIKFIVPHEVGQDEKVEPEDENIGASLLKTHVLFGFMGLVIGVLISSAFLFINVEFIKNFVLETYVGISTICIFIALLVAGLLTIRPDHDPLINDVKTATRKGNWVLIVHTHTNNKRDLAKELLEPVAVSVTASL